MNFAHFTYTGENIELFCARYRAALDKCANTKIIIPEKIQVVQFIAILDSHYEHWAANKREQMRRHPALVPRLDVLINEIVDECCRSFEVCNSASPRSQILTISSNARNSRSPRPERWSSLSVDNHAQINKKGRGIDTSSIGGRRETCNYCGYKHLKDRCWYKNPHLRHADWQPNRDVLCMIEEKGLPIMSNHAMQPSREAAKDKSYDEDPLNVFSRNYGLTPHDSVLALYI